MRFIRDVAIDDDVFPLHALKAEKLDLPPEATPALVSFYICNNSLGKTMLEGYYAR